MAIVEKLFADDVYIDAPTDGVTSACPALGRWLEVAATIIAGGDTPKLRMQGYSYHLPGVPNGPSNGLSRAIIDGEGATIDATFIANAGSIRESFAHSARVATVSAGATSATIIQGPYPNDVNLTPSFLSVGQWIVITGISMQAGGYPPNFQYNEFRKITSIVGNVVSWADPLVYTYLQTWPLCNTQPCTISIGSPAVVNMVNHGFSVNQLITVSFDVGGSMPTGMTRFQDYYVVSTTANSFTLRDAASTPINASSVGANVIIHTQTMDHGGPATIYGLLSTFEGEHSYSNLTVDTPGEIFGGGSTSIILDNVDFTGRGPCPSVSKSWIHKNSVIGTQNEVDKCVEYCEYNNCTAIGIGQVMFYSPGCMETLITGCTFKTLNGAAHNLTLVNSDIYGVGYLEGFLAGCVAYGRTNTITIDGTTVNQGQIAGNVLELATFAGWSFSGGTFSFPLTYSAAKNEALRCFVPGYKYIVGRGSNRNTTPETGSPIIFTVASMYQDATHFYIYTNLVSATWPNYGGGFQPDKIFSYAARAVTQTSSGPLDVTTLAEPGRTFIIHLIASSPPSYTNPGGQGDRTSIITVSGTMPAGGGNYSMLVNGTETDEYWFFAGSNNKTIVFDFGVGASKVINEFTWTQSNAITHGGSIKFAGSNDNSSYTDFPEVLNLGTSTTQVVPVTNSTGYRYYRLFFPGSTSGSPYIREIKFKIS